MGNEASRPTADGLTPRGYSPGSTPTGLSSPRTPSASNGSVRRAKSFNNGNAASADLPGHGSSNQAMDKTIQRMDKTIRKRVRGGITYNMKIILRGDKGTGKTALFHRLKGLPIPTSHEPTPQLQSATINWSFRANSEESVKCDVWDVVDKGFTVGGDAATTNGDSAVNTNPFEAGGGSQTSGAHMVATVDATTVDVYHETHGVVFLLDVTKPHTLEYVRKHLDQVPVHIPTLVLGNFRDCGAQRKIFKEDIQELLYGGGSTSSRTLRRPQELLYFECSLLNCYGLKALHQYFGIPFLQLKQQTIRQQLRIVEGEFAHLKHDLQAKIAEQRYAEYLDHIKTTGSDIRTGRRVSGGASASTVSDVVTATVVEDESPKALTRLDRTQSSSSDIVVGTGVADVETETENENESPVSEMPELPTPAIAVRRQVDLDDLPERATAQALQAGNVLKIDYTEAEQRKAGKPAVEKGIGSESNTVSPSPRPADEDKPTEPVAPSKSKAKAPKAPPSESKKASAPAKAEETVMNLEDFQVPKARYNELDDFYSDENSDEDAGDDDEDVVVGPGGRRLVSSASAKYSHKQLFLESDDSDSDRDIGARRARGTKKKDAAPTTQPQRSPRRQNVTKPTSDEPSVVAPTPPAPTPPSPTRVSPPSAPSPRAPVSPQARMSPQHSPRRRVKEPAVAASVEEPAVAEEAVAVVFETPIEHTEPAADTDHASATETAEMVEEPSIVKGVRIEQDDEGVDTRVEEEVSPDPVKALEPIDGPVDVAAHTQVEQKISQDVAPVPEVDELDQDDALDALVKTKAVEGTQSKGVVDDDDLVVGGDAGEMDSFFSDDDGEEEEKTTSVKGEVASEERVDKEDTGPVEIVAAEEKQEEIVSSSPGLSDTTASASAPAIVDSDSDSDSREKVVSSPHTSVVTQLKQQHQPMALDLSDDDSDSEPPTTSTTATTQPAAASTARARKVEILLSDDEDSDAPAPAARKPPSAFAPVQRIRESGDVSSFPSPPFAPMTASKSGNLLEDFLNDSGSDSDAPSRPPLASKRFGASAVNRVDDEEEEDDEDDGRFAAYDAKKSKQRTSKALRKQQREEIATMSASTSRTSSFSNTSESNSRTGSFVNQDVLAAIRAAEQDALRMLEASTPVAKTPKIVGKSADHDEEEASKKKKDREASSSSSKTKSKRREMILTDEDE